MKTLKKTLFIFSVLLGILFYSCGSDDDSNPPQTSETYIRFSANGTQFNFTDIVTIPTPEKLAFYGTDGGGGEDDNDFTISLPIDVVVGTFDVDDSFDGLYQLTFASIDLNVPFNYAESGTITVSNISGGYITGTFSGTLTTDDGDVIIFEDGEFRASETFN